MQIFKLPISLKSVQEEVKEYQELGVCTGCEKPIEKFKDRLSVEEFRLSGLCQNCQDKFFNSEEE